MDKEQLQLMSLNNMNWEMIRTRTDRIAHFISSGETDSETAVLIATATQLVIGELVANKDKYEKYPMRHFSEEEFVEIVLESMSSEIPDINSQKENEIHIDNMRYIIWGHIKTHFIRLTEIFICLNKDSSTILKDDDSQIFAECLIVVWTESLLRKRETALLEKTYE